MVAPAFVLHAWRLPLRLPMKPNRLIFDAIDIAAFGI